MKRGYLSSLTKLLLAFVIVALFASPMTVKATEAASEVKPIQAGTNYSYTWSYNDYSDCINKFIINKKGIVTLSAAKMYDNYNSEVDTSMIIYDSKYNIVWQADSDSDTHNITDKNKYTVGLTKGTYYLAIKASYWPIFEDESITTTYSYKFKATEYCETENNGTKKKANTIKLGKYYSAVYCEESYRTNLPYEDWFKVKLVKGKRYQIKLKNYEELFGGTAICDVKNPSGKDIYVGYYRAGSLLSENGTVTFKATKTGYYYIRLWNDGSSRAVSYKVYVKQK